MKVVDKVNIICGADNWAIKNQALTRILGMECDNEDIPSFTKNGRDTIATIYTGKETKGKRPIQVSIKEAGKKTQEQTGKKYIVT